MRQVCGFFFLLLCAASTWSGETPLRAPQVVFRGARSLEHLLRLTTQSAWRDPASPRPVAIVIDATPFTSIAEPEIAAALRSLDARVGDGRGSWRIGRLGVGLSSSVRRPSELAGRLGTVFAKPSDVDHTLVALRKSLAGFRAKGGVIVYVAASHFEDDHGLEDLLAELEAKRQQLNVIGPEGGFLHPHEAGPGRSGDTAWPHVFDRVMTNTWTFRRAVSVRVDGDTVAAYPAPPSSFGPYGLMRLAAATGGHYGIWGWNPLPRKGWVYDYGRCNRFAPDLRSRAEILADLQHRHLPRALLKAWHLVSSGACQFAAFPPPWDPVTFEPRARERVHGSGLPNPWRNASARDAFFRGMRGRLRSLDEAIGILDVAIARAGGKDTVDDRYRADAELMRHILRLYRFANAERREAYLRWERAASSEIPRDELAYQPHHWVSGGPAPERLRMSESRPYQTGRALEILRQHREFLTRFQGTPYAWVLSRNEIDTYRIVKQRRSASGRGGKANDSSRGRTPVTPGPGGSRGDGPTTGP